MPRKFIADIKETTMIGGFDFFCDSEVLNDIRPTPPTSLWQAVESLV